MQGRHWEAAEALLTAAALAPTDYDIVVGVANALRQVGKNQKAEGFYVKAVLLRPEASHSQTNIL